MQIAQVLQKRRSSVIEIANHAEQERYLTEQRGRAEAYLGLDRIGDKGNRGSTWARDGLPFAQTPATAADALERLHKQHNSAHRLSQRAPSKELDVSGDSPQKRSSMLRAQKLVSEMDDLTSLINDIERQKLRRRSTSKDPSESEPSKEAPTSTPRRMMNYAGAVLDRRPSLERRP